MAHTALLLLLTLAFKVRARGILIFWLISAVVLSSFGGWRMSRPSFWFCFLIRRRPGREASGRIFAAADVSELGSFPGLGSARGFIRRSVSCRFHLFPWWMLGILFLIGLVPDLRSRMSALRDDIQTRLGLLHFTLEFDVGTDLAGIFTGRLCLCCRVWRRKPIPMRCVSTGPT